MVSGNGEIYVVDGVISRRGRGLAQAVAAIVQAGEGERGTSVVLNNGDCLPGIGCAVGALVKLLKSEFSAGQGLLIAVNLVDDSLVGEYDDLIGGSLAGVAGAALVVVIGELKVNCIRVAGRAKFCVVVQRSGVLYCDYAFCSERRSSGFRSAN
jgi:hypothetical protein